jgi:cytochrome c oxidase subunit 2
MRLTTRAVLLAAVLALVSAAPALAGNGGIAPVAPASPNAQAIRDIWWLILGITLVIFVLVESTLIIFIVKYRRGRRPRTAEGAQVHGHTRTEIAWTIVPVLIVFAIIGYVFADLPDVSTAPAATRARTVDIQIVGHQYYWLYRYPGGQVSIDTMQAPVGDLVNLTVNAADVIHGWWIPALGGQIDAIPGRTNHTWFQAKSKGEYKGQCAQLCGIYHAYMLADVKVVSDAAYRAFLATHAPGSPVVAREAFVGVCSKCHGFQGKGGYGPPLQNREFQLDDITKLLTKGRGRMPAVGSDWSPAQIAGIVHYLQKTKGGASGG